MFYPEKPGAIDEYLTDRANTGFAPTFFGHKKTGQW
jgi:hypothetical protein